MLYHTTVHTKLMLSTLLLRLAAGLADCSESDDELSSSLEDALRDRLCCARTAATAARAVCDRVRGEVDVEGIARISRRATVPGL